LSYHDYSALYSPNEPIVFSGLSPCPDNGKLRLFLQSRDACTVEIDGRTLHPTGGSVELEFPLRNTPDVVSKSVQISSASREAELRISYYSPALYRKYGTESSGYIIADTDLPFRARTSTDLADFPPAGREKMLAFFGKDALVDPERERASRVLTRLADMIAAAPVNKSRPCAFDQGLLIAEDILAGNSHIACTGKSIVGRDFLLACGIPARAITLESPHAIGERGVKIRFSEGHTTNEMQIDGKWCWFDLSLSCLYALSERTKQRLSLWELFCAVNDPRQRGDVVFGVYATTSRATSEVHLDESETLRCAARRFFTSDKLLRYNHPAFCSQKPLERAPDH